jgi:hypothetical protein
MWRSDNALMYKGACFAHMAQQAQTGRRHDTLGSVLAAETVVQYSLSHMAQSLSRSIVVKGAFVKYR